MNPRIEIEMDIAAPPSRVFEALTRASELEKWFTEKAFVSEAEGRFDFWGRFTPGNPDRESGRHRLHAYEPPGRLAFDWRVRSKDTTVEIALGPSGRGTSLKLVQDAPARGETELSLTDFWLLSFENLRRLLEDSASPVRCDYSLPPRGGVELAVDISSDSGSVFEALIRPEHIDRWMTGKSAVEPVPGGRITFGWPKEGPVRILDIVPNEKLAYSWEHGPDPETVVTWTLERPNGNPARTRLTLVHSGFGPRNTEDFRSGWLKHVLWMKGILERGDSWVPPKTGGCDI